MFDFAETTKDMTAAEILNYYRNLYYVEPQVTERGIVANAINDYFKQTAPKTEWISVEERLPEHAEICLIFTKIHFIPEYFDECDYYEGVEISTFYQDRFLSKNGMYATYWMPLPEPPTMKGGAK